MGDADKTGRDPWNFKEQMAALKEREKQLEAFAPVLEATESLGRELKTLEAKIDRLGTILVTAADSTQKRLEGLKILLLVVFVLVASIALAVMF